MLFGVCTLDVILAELASCPRSQGTCDHYVAPHSGDVLAAREGQMEEDFG